MHWNKAEQRLKNGSPGHNHNNTLEKCCHLSREEHNGSAHVMKIGIDFFFGLPDLLILHFVCVFLLSCFFLFLLDFYSHIRFLNEFSHASGACCRMLNC